MKTKRSFILTLAVFAVFAAFAERNGPWPKEKAWEWYNAQPWIRGCNYMPASAANRLDMWQEFGSKERFEEMDRELALAESIGFNAVRVLLEENGFGAWYYEHSHATGVITARANRASTEAFRERSGTSARMIRN